MCTFNYVDLDEGSCKPIALHFHEYDGMINIMGKERTKYSVSMMERQYFGKEWHSKLGGNFLTGHKNIYYLSNDHCSHPIQILAFEERIISD